VRRFYLMCRLFVSFERRFRAAGAGMYIGQVGTNVAAKSARGLRRGFVFFPLRLPIVGAIDLTPRISCS
jgi:hypothetical protein